MLLLFWQFNIQRIVRRHLLSYLQLHQNIDRFSTLFYWYASKFAINLLIKSLPHLKRVWLIVTRQCNGAFEMQLQWDLQQSLYCKCTDEFASETRTATRSRRTRKRAFHFYSPGVVRRSHVAARQLSALLYCMSAPLLPVLLCRNRQVDDKNWLLQPPVRRMPVRKAVLFCLCFLFLFLFNESP